MSKLLSLVEGLDDNLKESPARKCSQFNFKKRANSTTNSTADNSLDSKDNLAKNINKGKFKAFTEEETHFVTNKKLKYCVGRLYNWLSIMETLQGKKDFTKFTSNFNFRKNFPLSNIEEVLRRSLNKGYRDILPVFRERDHFGEDDKDWPDINPRAKVKKLNELDEFVSKRVNFMLNEKKM